mmetsp:Transcript_12526/g.41819  ORF Transcript_12526/g.41819 Transcript_12526/m.41819 type:complete len:218 (-) Transcript_12526:691-1344(-)
MMTYAATRSTPLSQCDSLAVTCAATRSTARSRMEASKLPKTSVSGCRMGHANSVMSGMQRRAICVDEPRATAMARSILPRRAMEMAVACSAALPTMGRSTKPMNASGRSHADAAPCSAPVMTSERSAMPAVSAVRSAMAAQKSNTKSSSSSSDPWSNVGGASRRSRCRMACSTTSAMRGPGTGDPEKRAPSSSSGSLASSPSEAASSKRCECDPSWK